MRALELISPWDLIFWINSTNPKNDLNFLEFKSPSWKIHSLLNWSGEGKKGGNIKFGVMKRQREEEESSSNLGGLFFKSTVNDFLVTMVLSSNNVSFFFLPKYNTKIIICLWFLSKILIKRGKIQGSRWNLSKKILLWSMLNQKLYYGFPTLLNSIRKLGLLKKTKRGGNKAHN